MTPSVQQPSTQRRRRTTRSSNSEESNGSELLTATQATQPSQKLEKESEETSLSSDPPFVRKQHAKQIGSDGPYPRGVLIRLLVFVISLAVFPVASYFALNVFVFNAGQPIEGTNRLSAGNPAFSAVAAVIIANLIVFGYVLMAFTEEEAQGKERQKTS